MNVKAPQPRYKMVKDYVTDRLVSGEWPEDYRVPSENELVKDLGVSRMTVNRALRELTTDGKLRRVQGLGTFVAGQKPQSELLELKNIADEIKARGGTHSAELLLLRCEPASEDIAKALYINIGADVYHSIMVHHENDAPIQLEDRFVNPELAPDYLDQDFTLITPNQYLSRVAPLGEVEHVVEATLANNQMQNCLNVDAASPCLLLHRRTWSGEKVVSRAWLYHPGGDHRLGAHFSQNKGSHQNHKDVSYDDTNRQ